ncbi:ATP-binding cassette transporter snq2 [Rhodotorula toruloides]
MAAEKPPDRPGEVPASDSLLSSLPPPQPFAVVVRDLAIVAPPAQWSLPLAIPITVPRFVQRRLQKAEALAGKELLRNVNLDIAAGEVLAIIGGSGSGKTTLLNAIAGRATGLETSSGAIEVVPLARSSSSASSDTLSTTQPLSVKAAKKVIGYVRQDDFLLPFLTVRETLAFAAALRLPKTVSAETRSAIVEQTITELGLADAANVIVGGPFRKGISGGERRRLTIGCTLVQLPSVLVLDEPTTGLDSFTAFRLLETLRSLARRGRAVIVTLHGPRSDAFPIFDKLLLLSRGSPVYSGPGRDILPHFDSLGYPAPEHTNPLDFVIDLSSVDNRTDEAEESSKERVGALISAWRRKEASTDSSPRPRSPRPQAKLASPGRDVEKAERSRDDGAEDAQQELKRANLVKQTALLTRRGLRNVFRNYGQLIGFAVQAIIIGVVVGLVFLNPPETPSGVQSLKTVVYFSTPAMYYLSIILAVFILCGELIVFDREREDNMYKTVPWVASVFLSYLPANVVFPTIYAIIVYFMTGFRRDDLAENLLSFIAQCIMQQVAAWSYALLCCAINRSFAQASLLANGFSIPMLLSSGYLITNLGAWIAWTRWLSPYFYGFHWIALLQFRGRTFACDGVTGPARNQCEGLNVLRGMRFDLDTPLYVYPLGLLGFIVVTFVLATIILAFYHPGGVKHATQHAPSKQSDSHNSRTKGEFADLIKTKSKRSVDVAVNDLRLVVSRRGLGRKSGNDEKVILENVNASFPAGQVSVIMGPSGAGKSSLLQMLAGRLSSGPMSAFRSEGSIMLNNQEFDSSLASLVAFVEQEDSHHLPALTVRETLRYAARLRLKDRSVAACDARAEEVLRLLGLATCADTLVGGSLVKGISGGEKRRLSLAVQLLSDPAVLYADEPTSGLDAFTAQNVMQTLRDLASDGRTIVISVHQPRSDIWALFDNVVLLAKGGRTAFSGPASEILPFFESAGETCPPNFNPADFIIDAVSLDHRSEEAELATKQRVARIVDTWAQRQKADLEKRNSGSTLASPSHVGDKRPLGSAKLRKTPFARAFPVVLARSFKNLRRQPDVFVARLSNPPFMALLFWIYFARLGYGPSSSQDRIGLLQETTALPFVGMLACIAIFPSEMNLYRHEFMSSARYGVTTFLSVYTIQETITSAISSFLFSVIFTFGMNLQYSPARKFFEFWFSSWALISTGESVGIIFSAYTSNGGLATSLVSAALTLLAQLNGIISVTMPYFLVVIGWISPMRPQAELQIINEMTGLRFNCSSSEIASGACIATTGEQVLDTFGLPHGGTGKYIGILAALVVLWRLAAFAGLHGRVRFL